MKKLQAIRLITKICWMLSGLTLACYGLLLTLSGFLGSEPLPSIHWSEVVFGVCLFLTGGFFIRLGKKSG